MRGYCFSKAHGSANSETANTSSNLNITDLLGQLTASNVTISTTSGLSGNGDVTFVDPFTFSGSASRRLTVNATRDINVNAAYSSTGTTALTAGRNINFNDTFATANSLSNITYSAGNDITVNASVDFTNDTVRTQTFSAGNDIFFNANVTGAGSLTATAGRNITVDSIATVNAGGNLVLGAAGNTYTGTGTITMNGGLGVGGNLSLQSGYDGGGKRYASGETDWTGGITKCGNGATRTLLFEASVTMLTRSGHWSRLKSWAVRLSQRYGFKYASTALARKLAVVLHRMWVTETDFVYGDANALQAA